MVCSRPVCQTTLNATLSGLFEHLYVEHVSSLCREREISEWRDHINCLCMYNCSATHTYQLLCCDAHPLYSSKQEVSSQPARRYVVRFIPSKFSYRSPSVPLTLCGLWPQHRASPRYQCWHLRKKNKRVLTKARTCTTDN